MNLQTPFFNPMTGDLSPGIEKIETGNFFDTPIIRKQATRMKNTP